MKPKKIILWPSRVHVHREKDMTHTDTTIKYNLSLFICLHNDISKNHLISVPFSVLIRIKVMMCTLEICFL